MLKRFASLISSRKGLLSLCLITGSFLAVFFLTEVLLPGTFRTWNSQINDKFFQLRYLLAGKRKLSPYLVHAVINDSSFSSLDLTYGDRSIYGRVLHTLQAAGVAAIACDIFFSDSFYPENDKLLIQATAALKPGYRTEAGADASDRVPDQAIYYPFILQPAYYPATTTTDPERASGRTTGTGHNRLPDERLSDERLSDEQVAAERLNAERLSAELISKNLWHPKIVKPGRPLTARQVILPFSALAEQASGLAHITCEPDPDGVNRRFPLLYRYQDGYFPALTFRLLCDYLKVKPEDLEVAFGQYIRLPSVQLGEYPRRDIIIPIDDQARMIINFAGSWEDSFIHFPIHNLLQAEHDRDLQLQLYDDFEGALVIFSDISTRHKDYGPGIFDQAYPSSGLHLNLANTILTQDFMHDPGWPDNLLTGLCMILLLWFVATRLRPLGFLFASLGLYLVYFSFNLAGFMIFNRLTQLLPVSLACILSLMLLGFYRFFIEEQEKEVFKTRALAKEQLEQVNRELHHTNRKLKELDEYKTHFVQNITHEFRTPLTLIIGPLHSLLSTEYQSLPDTVKKLLPMIQLSAQKLLHLIDNLLDLSKLETGKMQLVVKPYDLAVLLQAITAYFKPLTMSKNLRLLFTSQEKSLTVYLDQEKLEKIMFNLLSNAVKFTPGGGSITVKLSPPVPAASAPLKRSWPHGPPRQLVRISVSDTGVGIPPAELESIFTRFGQAKSTGPGGYGGTGIGLALVKELAELHYGEIQVTSEPGQGTEFTLWLPWDKAIYKETEVAEPLPGSDPAPVVLSRLFTEELKSADRQEPAGEEEQAERGQAVRTFAEARKKAILLVEDDASLRAYLKHVLEDTYLVHEAGDGRTGLQSARTHRPDLIVSDWLMPLMNGQELLAAIREQAETAHIPFIMITANGPAGGWDQAQAPAPDDYLTKPFSPAELLVRIRNVLLLAAYRKEYLFTDSRLYLVPSAEIPAGLSRSSGGHKSRFPQEPILIVDDDPLVLTCYQTVLAGQGITNLILCRDSRQVMSLLLKKQVTAVLLDLSMPYVSGDELLKEIKKEFPSTTVIMVTGIQLTAVAVDCMKNGAYDYLVKPVEVNRLVALIQHCIEQKTLEAEVSLLQDTLQGAVLKTPEAFAGIVTQDAAMFDLFRLVEAFAAGTKPVLITGESGTGKELIADVLHRLSGRPGKFIKENIAGLDSTVFSDTLLGHTRGAFTGALDTRKGLVEEAEGGTLFLDEIGELEPDAQVKLLRLLEYGEYRPLGSDKIKRADVRIIVATNADLTAKIKEGTFRKDLYYRLAYKLHIPPLRERPADVPLLAEHFWKRAAQVRGKPVPLPAGLPALLQTYHYPGNIRELELMVESALSLCERPEQFLAYFGEYIGQHTAGSGLLPAPVPFSLRGLEQWFNSSPKIPALTEVEDLLLREAMKKAKGNQRLAAGWLGLSPSALNRRLKKTKL